VFAFVVGAGAVEYGDGLLDVAARGGLARWFNTERSRSLPMLVLRKQRGRDPV